MFQHTYTEYRPTLINQLLHPPIPPSLSFHRQLQQYIEKIALIPTMAAPPLLPEGYSISHSTPSVDVYLALRTQSGLTPFSREAAARGLPNSLFCVQVVVDEGEGEAVGMGRITGDAGCFFLLTDICILPAHRSRGLAKAIMADLMTWLRANVPKTGFVSLSADGRANELYRQFGFKSTLEEIDSVGMMLVM
ncbi:MAG: hypothetical protein Q9202_007010 [Teloschistes flavicans]